LVVSGRYLISYAIEVMLSLAPPASCAAATALPKVKNTKTTRAILVFGFMKASQLPLPVLASALF
jgi:hypothetical protein